MKRFFSIALSLLLAASCEIPFDLDQEGNAKIYVQGIVSNGDVFVTTKVANPVIGTVTEAGEMQQETAWNGDVFSLTVRAPGLEPVSGSTTVPPRLVVNDWSWERVQVDTIDATRVSLVLDHAPVEGEYYGIRILRTDTVQYMNGTSEELRNWLTPGYVLTAAESGSFDLEDFMQVNFDGSFLGGKDFQPITLITQKQFQGDTYSFYLNSFDASMLNNIRNGMPGGDTGAAGGGIISGEIGSGSGGTNPGGGSNPGGGGPGPDPGKIPVGLTTVYDFYFYRLSSDFYFYAKAMYQSNFDFLANMGLIPANFTWTNVRGGLGFVGALSSTHLGPLEVPKEN